jgi:DNA replication protein DnaC
MVNEQVNSMSYKLRLFGVQANFEKRAQQALASQMHPLEFLQLVLEDEALFRKDRAAKVLLTRAKFRTQAEIEDWDSTFDRGISAHKLRELASLAFLDAKQNLLILGRTGEGKTHLAVALGRRLCRENRSVTFLPVNFLFEEVMAAKTAGKYLFYIRKINKSDLIILDDFGLRNYTHEEATVLVDILEDRVGRGPVIVTSQVEPQGWLKLFEDPVIAEAIVDRLLNPSQKITLRGGSYREKLTPLLPTQKKLAPNGAPR